MDRWTADTSDTIYVHSYTIGAIGVFIVTIEKTVCYLLRQHSKTELNEPQRNKQHREFTSFLNYEYLPAPCDDNWQAKRSAVCAYAWLIQCIEAVKT
uniref:Uncharacterized protein n=1 Tax=Glossina palpalis gambiensis TaxID=67801 RepID=A0A1B0AQK8_9MUSC